MTNTRSKGVAAIFASASLTALILATGSQAQTAAATAPHAAPPSFPAPPRAPQGAPNVLMIMTDDVGFAASSTFGGPIPTPSFDRLASVGLKYNTFHTTALCSPTRAALLTGRNHHSVGFGNIAELATGYPGYTSVIPDSAATIGEVLRENGYSTSWFGKNHNTPDWENGPAGPFERWPNGLGFDYFYGFNQGETDQWAPALLENRNVVEPATQSPGYILDKDLADHALTWLRMQRSNAPDKPFLMYYAPGTAHAPHHAPADWIAKFKGQFDQGWDVQREQSFARQKAEGVIPADTVLTPRPKEIPAWDSLSADQKRLYARMMEVHAAALSYADAQIGRVLDDLQASGQLDNTIVIYIQGDNGASGEGGLAGTTNEIGALNGIRETPDYTMSKIDTLGGPMAYGHYPVGWAWAMNTPFQWTKQIASHLGGIRNGMVISWPKRIKAHGEVRSQFSSVIDIAPTLYEAIGVKAPASVKGVKQKPLEGVSMVASFDSASAPSKHTTQYFEMFANRALYKDGWMASTVPQRLPWIPSAQGIDPNAYAWELYDLSHDYAQSKNLAAENPKKLAELKAAFDVEAKRYNVLPLDATAVERMSSSLRPYPLNGKTKMTYRAGPERYPQGSFPNINNRSWSIQARIETPASGGDGTVVTQGGRFGGWGMVVQDGKPSFVYRRSSMPQDYFEFAAADALKPGAHVLGVDFVSDGPGLGRGGSVVFTVDGVEAAKGRIERTVPGWFTPEGATIGWDSGTPIRETYKTPFAFTGEIDGIDFELK